MEKLTLSVEELGKQLNICKQSAYKLINSRGFPVLTLGKRKVVPVETLKTWLRENTLKGD
jgi:excisionase family DNA binding protein